MAGMETWSKSAWTDAGQIVSLMDREADVEPALGKSLPEWFAGLVESGDLGAALSFLAHALPRYDCVVWAARSILDTGMSERGDPLMTAALRWIDNPEDDSVRRGAFEMAEAMPRTSPSRMLAQSVFFAAGSITPAEGQAVQAAPDICAKLASAAVLVGAYTLPDAKAAMRRALEIGEAMVCGRG